jgi:hypothetical protein
MSKFKIPAFAEAASRRQANVKSMSSIKDAYFFVRPLVIWISFEIWN